MSRVAIVTGANQGLGFALAEGLVQRMAVGDVVDMNKIEPGVDEARHAAACRLDDDAAGGRRAHVARADRCRGIDDDGRQSVAGHHRLDQSFSGDLAALVGADALSFRERDGFVSRRAGIRPAERGDAAGIDHALDAGDGPFEARIADRARDTVQAHENGLEAAIKKLQPARMAR